MSEFQTILYEIDKATKAFRVLSRPMLKDLRRANTDGALQIKYDEALIAYLQLVLGEGFGYWQMIDPRYSVEEATEILTDIMQHGLVDTSPSHYRPVDQQGPSGEVEDSTGTKTQLRDISLNGKYALRGRMGDAEVDVDLSKLASVRFPKKGARHQAELTMEDG